MVDSAAHPLSTSVSHRIRVASSDILRCGSNSIGSCNVAQHWPTEPQTSNTKPFELDSERVSKRELLIGQKEDPLCCRIRLRLLLSAGHIVCRQRICRQRIHGKGLRSALKFRNMFHIIDDEPAPLSSFPPPPCPLPSADHCPLRRCRR